MSHLFFITVAMERSQKQWPEGQQERMSHVVCFGLVVILCTEMGDFYHIETPHRRDGLGSAGNHIGKAFKALFVNSHPVETKAKARWVFDLIKSSQLVNCQTDSLAFNESGAISFYVCLFKCIRIPDPVG